MLSAIGVERPYSHPMDVRTFTTERTPVGLIEPVRALLEEAFEGRFTADDWAHACGGVHVVAFDGGRPAAHASVVERVLELDGTPITTGYVEAVATRPSLQGTGWGTAVMTELDGIIRSRFEMGALATGEHAFYERLGWRRWQGPTAVRVGRDAVPTPDDDDAIMVLLFGRTTDVDLGSLLVCDDRIGDVW
jgi:aminoglycoside 2'-N-acetyltransferase I